jgi:hypothetical protein
MWLSGANSARGRIAADVKLQSTAAMTKATNDVFSLWTGVTTSATSPKRKRKR